jgi:DNA-directed RNA polymerase subunit M/transcription elongation factor TFIIS
MSGSDLAHTLPEAKQIPCEKCGSGMKVYAHAQSRFFACPKCSAYYELGRDGAKFIQKIPQFQSDEPVFAIGTKVTIRGHKYLITGFLVKREKEENVRWREYFLFNPVEGYAYLAEYNGHWIFLKNTTSPVGIGKQTIHNLSYEEEKFRLYHKYTAKVVEAEGEFYFDILEEASCVEFIAPPNILTREVRKKEIRWFKGEYLQPSEIAQASEEKVRVPARVGIGSCQPNTSGTGYSQALTISIVATLLLFLAQLLFWGISKSEVVFKESYSIEDSLTFSNYSEIKGKPIVTQSFTLKGGTKNLAIEMYAGVHNSWFEAEMTLINEKTGVEQDLNMGVEYYSGYDGGESWTEGDPTTDEILSSVPEGVYHLIIVPIKPERSAHFEITVKRDVPRWFNFWMMLLALWIFPVIQYLRKNYFEHQRWMNSDYSPE